MKLAALLAQDNGGFKLKSVQYMNQGRFLIKIAMVQEAKNLRAWLTTNKLMDGVGQKLLMPTAYLLMPFMIMVEQEEEAEVELLGEVLCKRNGIPGTLMIKGPRDQPFGGSSTSTPQHSWRSRTTARGSL